MVTLRVPKDLDELRSLIENGGASETRFCEFKREWSSNNAVAKQLAGFAIEGGALVIGVAEPRAGKFEVTPIEHAGLPERVEQIAQSLIDPPLNVRLRVLTDPSDDSLGVLWITVPLSLSAPHQVGGVYYERGETQTRRMRDGPLKQLIRESATLSPRRNVEVDDIGSKLREAMAKDPIKNQDTVHVFGIAEPVGAGPEDLYEEIGDDDDGWRAFCEEARRIGEDYPLAPGESSPGACRPWYQLLDAYPSWDSGPSGYTVHYGDVDADNDRPVLRISFSDDGTIRYVNNVGSRRINNVGGVSPDEYFLHPGWIMGSCLDVLDAARAVARRTDQGRSWDIGFGLTGTEGLRARVDPQRSFGASGPFSDPSYKATLSVTHQELEKDTWGVARKLTRRFLRGCDHKFEQVARELGYVKPSDAT